MENLLEVTCLPIIVAIVYVVMAVYKHCVTGKAETWTRLIPLWAAIMGAVLGIYGYYKIPQLMLGDDVLTALLVGILSGLSAVGFNQIGKQLSKLITGESETDDVAESTSAETTTADIKENTEN